MIVQNLKNTTAPFHSLSEELNFSSRIMDGSITQSQYLLLLQRLYALFNQVAVLQKSNLPENILPATFFETKAAIVKEDIRQLRDNYNAMAPVFTSVPYYEYLGFCYVALGSMLGGQMIYGKLAGSKPQAGAMLPTAFYASCKESVSGYWKAFTAYLQTVDSDNHEAIINGATTAYLYFIYLSTVIQ